MMKMMMTLALKIWWQHARKQNVAGIASARITDDDAPHAHARGSQPTVGGQTTGR